MLKHSLLAAAVAALTMTPALAADAQGRSAPRVVYQAPFSWTGFYVGANVGYGFGTINQNVKFNGVSVADIGGNPNGAMAGGQLGYNYQIGSVVLGIEGDLDASWQSATVAGVTGRYTYLGTVRARVGYAFDRILPYVTAGAAFAKATGSAGGVTVSTNRNGWTVGAGVEYAFNRQWSVKAEYLYADLGKETGDLGSGITTDTDFKTSLVRAGLNYRF